TEGTQRMQCKTIVVPLVMMLGIAGTAAADGPKTAPAPDVAAAHRGVAAGGGGGRGHPPPPRGPHGGPPSRGHRPGAAAGGGKVAADQGPPAFLTALGIALDDSTLVRDNRLLAGFYRRVESDEERKRRLAVLGSPTVRGRRDWCQHFAVSCMLTALAG